MIRGTTPKLTVTLRNKGTQELSSINFEELKNVWFTIKDASNTEHTFEIDEVELDNEKKTISVKLTQELSLLFNGTARVQIKLLTNNGETYGTQIVRTDFNAILKEGVIE